MRPESIRWFERVYMAWIAINFALILYSFYWTTTRLGAGAPYGLTISMEIGTLAISTGFNVLLFYFIGRRASNVGKWIFVATTLFACVSVVRGVIAPNFLPAPLKMGVLFLVGLDFTMIMLMFQPDSRDWFERRGVTEADYADTFS